ncbi:TPA: hypothetical protein ACF2DJ_002326 [Clostridium perfringens]|uniref:hypothetical protein n=1 Tax=Clostridium perfringens TaxID=1502 RepID=UPI001CCDAE0F|nr:hypothetical protein [Clostridium perfringens]UBK51262.1 hypothetical protein KLF52_15165 [Clostridium perfringens]
MIRVKAKFKKLIYNHAIISIIISTIITLLLLMMINFIIKFFFGIPGISIEDIIIIKDGKITIVAGFIVTLIIIWFNLFLLVNCLMKNKYS